MFHNPNKCIDLDGLEEVGTPPTSPGINLDTSTVDRSPGHAMVWYGMIWYGIPGMVYIRFVVTVVADFSGMSSVVIVGDGSN